MRTALLLAAVGLAAIAGLRAPAALADSAAPCWSDSWMFSWPDGPPGRGFAPSAWVDRHRVGASLGGSFAFGLGAGREAAPALRGPVLEVAARGARRSVADAARGLGAGSSRLHLARDREGAWVGASLVGTDEGAGRGLPLAGGGAWMQRGRFTISIQVVRLLRSMRLSQSIAAAPGPRDSSSGGVTGEEVLTSEVEPRPLTGAETAVAWSAARLDVQSRAGISIAERERPARWGELRAAFWTRGDLAIFARAASGMSVAPSRDSPRGTEAALGIQFVPGRAGGARAPVASARAEPAFRIEPLGEGRHRILIGAVAREVEVCTDATGWSPAPARRIGGDTWEVVLDLAPGVHRIAMRCDGGPWRPPPGLPSTKDEFGGRVGLVVVE